MSEINQMEPKEREKPKPPFYVYGLHDGFKGSYIGFTNALDRRLRKHNGDLKGGAKSTRRQRGNWTYRFHLTGFKTYEEALSAEWRMKHPSGKRGRTQFSVETLKTVLRLERWSKKQEGLALGIEENRIYVLTCTPALAKELRKSSLFSNVELKTFE